MKYSKTDRGSRKRMQHILAAARLLHKTSLVAACFWFALVGCAPMMVAKRPQLYPNDKLASTSSIQAQSDVDRCMSLADSYIKEPNKYTEVAKQGLIGGALGAGTGAVAGTIMGEAGRGTGAGAAVGGIIGILKGLSEVNERSPSYERFVEHCLQKQGYEIIGWGG